MKNFEDLAKKADKFWSKKGQDLSKILLHPPGKCRPKLDIQKERQRLLKIKQEAFVYNLVVTPTTIFYFISLQCFVSVIRRFEAFKSV